MGVLFDTKLVGLQEQSQMAADIEELASRAKQAHEAPAAEEAGEEVQTVAPVGAASAPPPAGEEGGLQLYGLEAVEVGGGGDCQFRALAYHLFGDGGKHLDVRGRACAVLRAFPGRYKPYAEEWDPLADGVNGGRTYEAWVERLSRQGEWGGVAVQ
eukprot:COSAG01_NODE_8312_length_2836_cov_24.187797_3_plen_156_part_00